MSDEPVDLSNRRRRRSSTEKDKRRTAQMSKDERLNYERAQRLSSSVAEVFKERVRVVNMFEEAGVLTMVDFVALKTDELLSLPNFGEKTFREVIDTVLSLGLSAEWTKASIDETRRALRDVKKKSDNKKS